MSARVTVCDGCCCGRVEKGNSEVPIDFLKKSWEENDIAKKVKSKIKGLIEFVGPICESTCKFGTYKNYQNVKENEYVAITNVGAYGSSLSSNYNTRPLIAEILVNKNKFRFIRKKQNLLKLIND